jgi:hypothetical protein
LGDLIIVQVLKAYRDFGILVKMIRSTSDPIREAQLPGSHRKNPVSQAADFSRDYGKDCSICG